MKLAIYARISTPGQTLDPQLLELRAAAKSRGLVPAHEITDIISGSKASREGLDRLLAMVEAREVDAIMAVKIDRIARSMTNFVRICALLTKNKVALIIPGQGIDTSNANPCGELQLSILAAIAQFERSLIQERTKAGLANARAQGKVLGRISPTMPAPDARGLIVAEWRKKTGGRDYDTLSQMLGGVNRASAWREAKKWPDVAQLAYTVAAPQPAVAAGPLDLED